MKHLTVEVQALLSKPENKQGAAMLTTFSALQRQGGGDMKSFAAGSTLLTINEPGSHRKLEVHIDSDDLSGDQDTLQLSCIIFVTAKSSRMKEMNGKWRLHTSQLP